VKESTVDSLCAPKEFCVLPQATPKIGHIRFDSVMLASIYAKEVISKLPKNHPDKKLTMDKLCKHEEKNRIWNHFFLMDKVEGLRPHSQFGYSISTDGVSASVQFIKYVEKVPVEEYRAKLQKKVYYEKYILGIC
jgi:hypothetical protein